MEIFKLVGSVFVDNEKANKRLDQTDKKGSGVGKTLGKMGKSALVAGGVLASGIAVGTTAIIGLADKAAQASDRVDKMSQQIGFSTNSFQEWDFILSQNGTSIDSLGSGIKTLTNRAAEAAKGVGVGSNAFKKLGVTVKKADGTLKSQEKIFEETIKALQGVSDETERAALANELFGRSGQELAPLLNQSAESIDSLKQEAHDLGLVMDEKAIDAGVQFTDTMDKLKRSFQGVLNQGMAILMPVINDFMNLIIDNMPMIKEILGGIFDTFTPILIDLSKTLFPPLLDLFNVLIDAILPPLMDLVSVLTDTILPPLLDLFQVAIDTILPPLIDMFRILVDKIMPPLNKLFEIIIEKILPPFLDLLQVVIEKILPPLVDLFGVLVDVILPPVLELFEEIIDALLPPLIELFSDIIDNIMPPLMDLFNYFAENVLPPLMDLIKEIVELILPPLQDSFNFFAEDILPRFIEAFEALEPAIKPIMDAITDAIQVFLAVLQGDWETAWEEYKSYFENIWEGIKEGLKGFINLIIDALNGMIRGMNKMSFSVPDWVPAIGGKKWGFNIGEIPKLAEGGDIIKGGRVLVGEEGPEILDLNPGARVTPLDKAGYGLANITVELDGRTIAKSIGAPLTDLIVAKTGLVV